MIKTAREYRVDYVFAGTLTLHGVGKDLYYRALGNSFPNLLPRYRQLFRGSSQPGRRYRRILESKVKNLCLKYGVRYGIV